jgi:hypothetical protein
MRYFLQHTRRAKTLFRLGIFGGVCISMGVAFIFIKIILVQNNDGSLSLKTSLGTPSALATYQFFPTNGTRVTGTEQTITSATAAAAEGVNVGSWKGTLADDNFHWAVASTTSGINVNLTVGAVELHGANMLMIETEVDLDATAPNLLFQICDWTSSTGVDAAADTECTTGGWRTINLRKTAFTSATATAFHFQIYDGYWSDGSNAPRSTPLTNFVSSNQIKVRYYASNNTTSVVSIDYLRIFAVINPIYSPADFTNLGSGASSGDYTDTVLGVGQSGSDDNRNGAAGTAGSIPDMYWSFKNVKTPGGTSDFNTILVRSEYSCSATGINFRPKIYNFNSSTWEDLTTGNIACSATDAANAWAKNNVTISNYISSGEIRVGFYGLANGTNILRADFIYIMLGRTNTDTGACEISFGTNSANDCSNTRNLDMTAASPNTWNIATADESGTMGAAYYPNDNDADATTEEAAASHVRVSLDEPANSLITSVFFASRHMSGTAGTVQASLRDYSGYVSITGGFTDIGASATTALVYTDNVSVGTIASGGIIGITTDPYRYQQSVSNELWTRLRTSTSGATTNNSINQWDFSMVSFQWIEDSTHPSKTFQFTPTASFRTTGTAQNITSIVAPAAEGSNVGGDTTGWKGALANDDYHWGVASTTSGLNIDLTFGNFALNGANALILESEFDLDATAPNILIQICDWVSSTGVDAAADARCTTGGWRTVNIRKVVLNNTAQIHNHHFQIYDGYWSDGSNTPRSTPLTNFVDGSNNVRVRFYSTVNTTSVFSLDFIRLYAFVSPLYSPADLTNSGSGAIVSDYTSAQIGYFAGSVSAQSGSDDTRSGAAGTAGSIPNFYFSFKNVKTFTGMNSILVRSEHRCSAAAGLTYRPRIWNFSAGGGSGAWEDLTTGTILCSTTDATNAWAKNNVTLSNYISSGEIRIGFYGLGNSTASIEADYIYLMLGMTNSDSSECEISFGTGTATDCTKTRDLDMTGAQSAWIINPEAESTNFSHTYYAIDNGTTPDTVPEGMASGHVRFTPGGSPSGMIANVFFSQGFTSGFGYSTVISGTSAGSLFDYSGLTATGGSVNVGSTATNTLIYSDSVSATTYANLGVNGVLTNAEDYVDTLNNEIWMRFKNTVGRIVAVSDGGSLGVDWAFTALGWVE